MSDKGVLFHEVFFHLFINELAVELGHLSIGININGNKRTEIRLDFLRSQIFKKSICGGHF